MTLLYIISVLIAIQVIACIFGGLANISNRNSYWDGFWDGFMDYLLISYILESWDNDNDSDDWFDVD